MWCIGVADKVVDSSLEFVEGSGTLPFASGPGSVEADASDIIHTQRDSDGGL